MEFIGEIRVAVTNFPVCKVSASAWSGSGAAWQDTRREYGPGRPSRQPTRSYQAVPDLPDNTFDRCRVSIIESQGQMILPAGDKRCGGDVVLRQQLLA